MADYNSSLTAQEIESTLVGAVVYNKNTMLTEAQKAQARKNIGAGSSDSGLVILGYFDTLEELQAGVESPSAGDAYGVGAAYPYDIYIFDGLHSEWINNGNIRGADGKDGSDASVTAENIKTALGYTPGKMVRNLLDNSDFRNPVNQRGQTSYTGAVYTIDRWRTYGSTDKTVTLDNGILISAGIIDWGQPIPNSVFAVGKTYTFAVMTDTGRIGIVSTTYEGAFNRTVNPLGDTGLTLNATYMWTSDITLFALQNTGTADIRIIWAAIYEGEYTAETLPEYQPKGYGAELAECQRYYYRLNGDYAVIGYAYTNSSTEVYCGVVLPVEMRAVPSISNSGAILSIANGGVYTAENPFLANTGYAGNTIKILVSGFSGMPQFHSALIQYKNANSYIDFIADL